MLTGTIWLDFEDIDEERHYKAAVTRAIFRDDELVMEFSGHDPDDGRFSGECKLRKQGAVYFGPGSFTAGKESIRANVSVTVETTGSIVSASGTWHDVGDRDAYQVSVELNSRFVADDSFKSNPRRGSA